MIKTYEIDLDDALVDSAEEIFNELGTNVDTAIKIFLKQAVLRKGFPFTIALSDETEKQPEADDSIPAATAEPKDDTEFADLHDEISEEEECASATAVTEPVEVPPVSPEIAARVAANEALVAEMRNEIGDKEVTPEFDENEDDGTHGDYDSEPELENESVPEEEEIPAEAEIPAESESSAETAEADEEDEDETTPDNLFDAWDVGDEEEVGCR